MAKVTFACKGVTFAQSAKTDFDPATMLPVKAKRQSRIPRSFGGKPQ
jgi:hypothetical protein